MSKSIEKAQKRHERALRLAKASKIAKMALDILKRARRFVKRPIGQPRPGRLDLAAEKEDADNDDLLKLTRVETRKWAVIDEEKKQFLGA